jgi:hypothetical protein
MKTDDLIKNLSTELRPAETKLFYATSFAAWLIGTFGILALSFYFLPFREDLLPRFHSIFFVTETALCFALFLVAVLVAYRSSIPSLFQLKDSRVGWAILALLGVMVASRVSVADIRAEFLGEMSFYRGRCGPIMLILGTLDTVLLMALARRGAPIQPRVTGLWIALASGALGLLVMQFICDHENFLHMLLWHALPMGFLMAAGAAIGQRVLRW